MKPKSDILSHTHDPHTDIHTFVFSESSAAALDAWFAQMEEIYTSLQDSDKLRLLLDIRISGTLPLAYSFSRGTRWANNLHVHPQSRLAFVHHPDYMLSLASTFFRTLNWKHLKVQFFADSAEADALLWLKDF